MSAPIITVTKPAREYINRYCRDDATVMRVSVNNKGCSGHKYQLDLVDKSSLLPADELINWEGGALAIDARSIIYLLGTTLDLEVDVAGTRLTWINPNAAGICGCGESFSSRSC